MCGGCSVDGFMMQFNDQLFVFTHCETRVLIEDPVFHVVAV